MKLKLFVFAALIAVVMLAGFQQGAFAKGGGTKTIIALAPGADFSNAKGKAVYKVNGTEREFQVEVENIKKLAGKTVKVYVNGTLIGGATVDSLGEARLNRNTELGQSVPFIQTGDVVQVKTNLGKVIVSGKF